MTKLLMSVGRDYRMSGKYEYVIFDNEEVVARKGFFASYAQAKRAGIKAGDAIYAQRDAMAPELPL